jgi:hypothetical protein
VGRLRAGAPLSARDTTVSRERLEALLEALKDDAGRPVLPAADFRGATFSGGGDFRRATFSDDAVFSEATFSGLASFGCATFSGDAVFHEATFSGLASFGFATFSDNAVFHEATFSGLALCDGATFGRTVVLERATFSDNAGPGRVARAGFGWAGIVCLTIHSVIDTDNSFKDTMSDAWKCTPPGGFLDAAQHP